MPRVVGTKEREKDRDLFKCKLIHRIIEWQNHEWKDLEALLVQLLPRVDKLLCPPWTKLTNFCLKNLLWWNIHNSSSQDVPLLNTSHSQKSPPCFVFGSSSIKLLKLISSSPTLVDRGGKIPYSYLCDMPSNIWILLFFRLTIPSSSLDLSSKSFNISVALPCTLSQFLSLLVLQGLELVRVFQV